MNESEKFAWAFLLKNGYHTSGEYSYYGGCYRHAAKILQYEWRENKLEMYHQGLLEKIRNAGIDWNLTQPVQSNIESEFEGTFSPSSESEWLFGTLYTLDGDHYSFAYKDEAGMSSYIQNIRRSMAIKEETDDFLRHFS